MKIEDYFTQTDDIIAYITAHATQIENQLIAQQFVGFLSVAAVTVYELAIKEIFVAFAKKKHFIFGIYVENKLKRINGQIRYENLHKLAGDFGEDYASTFKDNVTVAEKDSLRNKGRSILSAYNNIIVWRHVFAHKGEINRSATLQEAGIAYQDGKEIIFLLRSSMA